MPLARQAGGAYNGNHMVTDLDEPTLDRVFAALADPSRRAILARLAGGEATVGELAEPFAMSRPAISKHLDVLERAGLVHRVADGRVNRCHLDGQPLRSAVEWMEQYRRYWEGQLDALARYFDPEETR
jgi:DNA-binding transcriptional ArsR family regulator